MTDRPNWQFQPGRAKTGGRKKGTPNRYYADLRDAVLQAAHAAGGKKGLIGYLTDRAKDTPGPFLALLGRIMPKVEDNQGDDELPANFSGEVHIIVRGASPDLMVPGDTDEITIPANATRQ